MMNTNKQKMADFIQMSQAVGARKDYVQGGGGNTSVKLSDGHMAVKASGFRLNQIKDGDAYVVVNAKEIRQWYASVNMNDDRDFEKESTAIAKEAVVPGAGPEGLRPSVEAGFHAVLGNYVVHTHAVYANLLCCSAEGREIVKNLFTDAGFPALWIPYINPGFCLTVKMMEEREAMISATGADPHIIFMQNHGLIVWADEADDAVKLHDEVNNRILQYFKLDQSFPEPVVKILDTAANAADTRINATNASEANKPVEAFTSGTKEVQDFLKNNQVDPDYFEKYPLYPDQLVYLNSGMSGEQNTRKIRLSPNDFSVVYKAGEPEALAMEETLLGFVWVMETIKNLHLTLQTMSETDVDFIRNWESEAYRRSLVQKTMK